MYVINLYKRGRVNMRIEGFKTWVDAAVFAYGHHFPKILGDIKILEE